MAIALTIAPALAPFVRLGVLTCDVGHASDRDAGLDAPIAEAERAVRAGASPDIGPARTLYRSIGIDPTRTRPSSEALLRRIQRGDALPRVNTLVDIGNWCSVEVQLPYGLYDLDRVEPPVDVRRGQQGEEYVGIRKDIVHLNGRLALADARGPFGNPTSDSARTMVTSATRRVLVVVYGPAALPPRDLASVLDVTAARYAQFAGGRETWRWVS